jgi:hypothetical protein
MGSLFVEILQRKRESTRLYYDSSDFPVVNGKMCRDVRAGILRIMLYFLEQERIVPSSRAKSERVGRTHC